MAKKKIDQDVEVGLEKPTEDKERFPEKSSKDHTPIVAVPVKTAKAVDPKAQRSDVVHTAIATKTCTRFVGGWMVLEAGKEVKASKEVLESLRLQGLVR